MACDRGTQPALGLQSNRLQSAADLPESEVEAEELGGDRRGGGEEYDLKERGEERAHRHGHHSAVIQVLHQLCCALEHLHLCCPQDGLSRKVL